MLYVNNMLKLETVTRKGYDNFHDADYNYYDSVVIGGQRGWMRCKRDTDTVSINSQGFGFF